MKKLIHYLLAGLLFACTGCKEKPVDKSDLVWGTVSFCSEQPIAPGDSLCYHLEFHLDTLQAPDSLSAGLARVICDSILGQSLRPNVAGAMEAAADSIEGAWRQDLAEMYSPDVEYKDMFQFNYTMEGKAVENGRTDILSYRMQLETYLGGAHGSYCINYYNFDLQSGRLLSVRDIVPANGEKQVLKAMEEQLCKDWDAVSLTDLQEKTGITLLGDLYVTDNFLLGKDSVTFLFNQYEIAPYAAGLIGVTIPLPATP